MPKHILFLSKLKGKRKAFFEWKSIHLSYELSLTCAVNVNYYKSVHHPIPTRKNREPRGSFQNKSISSAFNWVSRYILFLAKLRGEENLSWRFQEGGLHWLWDYPQEHLVVIRDEKVSTFVKFEIILPLLCFLLGPLTSKNCKTWSSMTNFWIDSRTYQK